MSSEIRVIKVVSCCSCPFIMMDNLGADRCEKTGYKLTRPDTIPTNCPLSVSSEYKIKLLKEAILSARMLLVNVPREVLLHKNRLNRYNIALARLIKEKIIKR